MAAEYAVQAGDPLRALTLIERCRTVITGEQPCHLDPRSLAAAGPIVALIDGDFGTYAVIVTADLVEAIELPAAHHVFQQTSKLSLAMSQHPDDPESKRLFSEVLDWLWVAVAEPVLFHR